MRTQALRTDRTRFLPTNRNSGFANVRRRHKRGPLVTFHLAAISLRSLFCFLWRFVVFFGCFAKSSFLWCCGVIAIRCLQNPSIIIWVFRKIQFPILAPSGACKIHPSSSVCAGHCTPSPIASDSKLADSICGVKLIELFAIWAMYKPRYTFGSFASSQSNKSITYCFISAPSKSNRLISPSSTVSDIFCNACRKY
eukprot:246115_1